MSAWSNAMLESIRDGNPRLFTTTIPGLGSVRMSCSDFLHVNERERGVLTQILSTLPANLAVLDMGTGVGRHLEAVSALKPQARLFGVEPNNDLRAYCVGKFGQTIVPTFDELPPDQRYDLVFLMGNGLGIWGGEAQTRAGLQRMLELLKSDGIILAESSPLGSGAYNAYQLSHSYDGLADPPMLWGFATYDWAQACLINLGYRDVQRHPANHPQAFLVSARKQRAAVEPRTPKTIPHESWAKVYDEVYEAIYGQTYDWFTRSTLDLVGSTLRPGASIVDLGAGTGRLAIPLANQSFQITAVERSPAMLQVLREKAKAAEVNIQTVCRTIDDFEIPAPCDLLLCVFTVLNYLTKPAELKGFANCCAAACAPEGKLLLSFAPNLELFRSALAHTPVIPRRGRSGALITRRQSIQLSENGLYQYAEHITYERNGSSAVYEDTFQLRQWTKNEILDAFGQFEIESDLSQRFANTGESYVLLRKRDS